MVKRRYHMTWHQEDVVEKVLSEETVSDEVLVDHPGEELLMNPDSKDTELHSYESDWVKDALKLQKAPPWIKRLAVGLTITSCALYGWLYILVSQYRTQVADSIRELTIFTRVVLNIYQPFLVVFVLISLSLLILLDLKIRKYRWSYKSVLLLMGFNTLFALILFGVSVLKVI